MSSSSFCALGFQPLRKIPQMNYPILEVNHVRIWKTKIDALIAQVNCIFRYQLDHLFQGIFFHFEQIIGNIKLMIFEQRKHASSWTCFQDYKLVELG